MASKLGLAGPEDADTLYFIIILNLNDLGGYMHFGYTLGGLLSIFVFSKHTHLTQYNRN